MLASKEPRRATAPGGIQLQRGRKLDGPFMHSHQGLAVELSAPLCRSGLRPVRLCVCVVKGFGAWHRVCFAVLL